MQNSDVIALPLGLLFDPSAACCLGRRDNFVEQREHRRMAPYVVDVGECGTAVQRTHGFDGKIMCLSAVIGCLVSRHYQCA